MARTQIHDESALFDLLIAVVDQARKDAPNDYRARYFLQTLGVEDMAHEPKPPTVDDETRARLAAMRNQTPEQKMAAYQEKQEADLRRHWRGLYTGSDQDFAAWWEAQGRQHAHGQQAQAAAETQAALTQRFYREF